MTVTIKELIKNRIKEKSMFSPTHAKVAKVSNDQSQPEIPSTSNQFSEQEKHLLDLELTEVIL